MPWMAPNYYEPGFSLEDSALHPWQRTVCVAWHLFWHVCLPAAHTAGVLDKSSYNHEYPARFSRVASSLDLRSPRCACRLSPVRTVRTITYNKYTAVYISASTRQPRYQVCMDKRFTPGTWPGIGFTPGARCMDFGLARTWYGLVRTVFCCGILYSVPMN